MAPASRLILDKAVRMIETSDPKHKASLDRWLSLANAHLHKDASWSVIGASMALQERYTEKFGQFTPRIKPVTL